MARSRQALVHDGRAKCVVAQALEPFGVAAIDADGSVQGEAVEVGAEPAARGVGSRCRTLADPRIAVAGARAERGPAGDGGGAQRVEERGIVPVDPARIGIGQLAGLAQVAQHAAADLADEAFDVFVGDRSCRVERGLGLPRRTREGPVRPQRVEVDVQAQGGVVPWIATTAPALAFAIPCVLATRP